MYFGGAVIGTIPVASVPAGSTNYIQNTTSSQASSNFNISGNGTAGGTLKGDIVNATTQFNIAGTRALTMSFANSNLFGGFTGNTLPTGTNNTFFGMLAGTPNTGSDNSFFGSLAGNANHGGELNSFFGSQAGGSNNSGSENSFFGYAAGAFNLACCNSFFGRSAGQTNSMGQFNSFFGSGAGSANNSGSNNTFIGQAAGDSNVGGSNNTMIGAGAGVGSASLNYATAIGAGARVNRDNTIILGRTTGQDEVVMYGNLSTFQNLSANTVLSSSITTTSLTTTSFNTTDLNVSGNLGVGTSSPATKVHVTGSGIIRARINSDVNAGMALTLSDQPKWSVATVAGGHFQVVNDAIGQNAVWIDSATNNVGIGSTSPSRKLQVTQPLAGASALFAENTFSGNTDGVGVEGRSLNNPGRGTGGFFQGGLGGVKGIAQATTYEQGATGVSGIAFGSAGSRIGVFGLTSVSAGALAGYGLLGEADGAANINYGVYGIASGGAVNWAGYFDGNSFVGGNLGIGAAPLSRLHLNANASSPDFAITLTNSANSVGRRGYRLAFDNNRFTFQRADDAGYFAENQVSIDGQPAMSVSATLTQPTNSMSTGMSVCCSLAAHYSGLSKWFISTRRLRLQPAIQQNIHPFYSGLALINRLRPVSFEWKQGGKPDMGLIAEEVAKVEPLLVTHNDKGEIEGGKYDRIAVVLLNAVKEQQHLIEHQQQQIEGLKNLVCSSHRNARACK